MLFDYALGDRQAKAGAARFGGEKGLEEMFQVAGGDTWAGVLDHYSNLGQGRIAAIAGRGFAGGVVRRDGKGSVWRHSLKRVKEQIHKSLLQFVIIAIYRLRRGLK